MRVGKRAQPLAEVGAVIIALPLVGSGTMRVQPPPDFGSTVANVIGGSIEAFTSDCKWLFRSVTQLCSFVSAASAL